MKTENYNQLISGYNSVLVVPNMSALAELRALNNEDKEPDEITAVVKCID